MSEQFLKPLVEDILRNVTDYEWTVQGFGMLRTYLGPPGNKKAIRLNIWDRRFTIPNVSVIHDHPWSFSSTIVAGGFCNVRYKMVKSPYVSDRPTHHYCIIKTGIGGGMDNDRLTNNCFLKQQPPELYGPGDDYRQDADEIHESMPLDGSVTINERVGDTEQARVFWPHGTEWVDAIPRPATREETLSAAKNALNRWF